LAGETRTLYTRPLFVNGSNRLSYAHQKDNQTPNTEQTPGFQRVEFAIPPKEFLRAYGQTPT